MSEHGSRRDAVWLDVTELTVKAPFNRGYAQIEGTFVAGPRGHFGAYSGAIGKITRFEASR
jgi:hypothetical protein